MSRGEKKKIPQPILPTRYPRHITASRLLRRRYDHLHGVYSQLQHLWHVQLKHHRDEWSLRAAHEIWWEHGPRTFEGRRFGWNNATTTSPGGGRGGNWLTEAMEACRAQIEELEDPETARRMRRMRAVRRYTVDLLAPHRPRPLSRGGERKGRKVGGELSYLDLSKGRRNVGVLPGSCRDVPMVIGNDSDEEEGVDLLAFPELDLGGFETELERKDEKKGKKKKKKKKKGASSNMSFASTSTSTLSSSSRKRALSEKERDTDEGRMAKKKQEMWR